MPGIEDARDICWFNPIYVSVTHVSETGIHMHLRVITCALTSTSSYSLRLKCGGPILSFGAYMLRQ
jgi:hypothetical protein